MRKHLIWVVFLVLLPGGGNANPLQYPCLENSTDGGAWGRKESDRTELTARRALRVAGCVTAGMVLALSELAAPRGEVGHPWTRWHSTCHVSVRPLPYPPACPQESVWKAPVPLV